MLFRSPEEADREGKRDERARGKPTDQAISQREEDDEDPGQWKRAAAVGSNDEGFLAPHGVSRITSCEGRRAVAVHLRLARGGRHKRPFYRVVAADSRMPRDGRFLEVVGTYDPLKEAGVADLKQERVLAWHNSGKIGRAHV